MMIAVCRLLHELLVAGAKYHEFGVQIISAKKTLHKQKAKSFLVDVSSLASTLLCEEGSMDA